MAESSSQTSSYHGSEVESSEETGENSPRKSDTEDSVSTLSSNEGCKYADTACLQHQIVSHNVSLIVSNTLEKKGVCQEVIESNGNSKQVLLAMAYGLKGPDGELIADWSVEPFKSAPSKKSLYPNAGHLKEEVKRRAMVLLLKKPRPNQWSIPKCQEFLAANCIKEAVDVGYLNSEVALLKKQLQDAQNEKELLTKPTDRWVGIQPWLRLVRMEPCGFPTSPMFRWKTVQSCCALLIPLPRPIGGLFATLPMSRKVVSRSEQSI